MLIQKIFYIFILSFIVFKTEAIQLKKFFYNKTFNEINKNNKYKNLKMNLKKLKYKKIYFDLKESQKFLKKKIK